MESSQSARQLQPGDSSSAVKASGKKRVAVAASTADQIRSKRSTKKTTTKRPDRAAQARLACGESSVGTRDVGGNIQKTKDKLSSLLGEAGANTVEGGMKLKLLVEGGGNPTSDLCTKSEQRVAFSNVESELLTVLAKAPADRSEEDLVIIDKYCGWHPIFKETRPMLRRKMYRWLILERRKFGDLFVVQSERADSFYICYNGELSVHVHKDTKDLKKLLSNKNRVAGKSMFLDRGHLLEEGAEILGSRVAVLKKGHAFGESGLDPSGEAHRGASIIVANDETLLFRVKRTDLLSENVSAMINNGHGFGGEVDADFLTKLAVPAESRTAADVASIETKIGWHPFVAHLSLDLRRAILKYTTLAVYDRDAVVMLQEDEADAFYIVYDGEVAVCQNSSRLQAGLAGWKVEKMAQAGKEIAEILEQRKKFMSQERDEVRWETEFQKRQEALPDAEFYANDEFVKKAPKLAADEKEYSVRDVMSEGGVGGNFASDGGWSLREGAYHFTQAVDRTLLGKEVARLKKGASFGENGLQADGLALRSATVFAKSDKVLLLKLCCTDIQMELQHEEEEEEEELVQIEEEDEEEDDADEFAESRKLLDEMEGISSADTIEVVRNGPQEEETENCPSSLRAETARNPARLVRSPSAPHCSSRRLEGSIRVGRSTLLGVLADVPPQVKLKLMVAGGSQPKKKHDINKARKKDKEITNAISKSSSERSPRVVPLVDTGPPPSNPAPAADVPSSATTSS